MVKSKKYLSLFLWVISAVAHSETVMLKKDAVLCETEVPFSVFKEEPSVFLSKTGSEVMKNASSKHQFYKISAEINKTFKQAAIREESIINKPRSARAAEDAAAEVQNEAKARQYKEILDTCVAGNISQSAEVLETRPISQISKVKTNFNGKSIEVWTHNYYLSQ